MTATRRTALAMLGLAPVSAVGAETFMSPQEKPGESQSVRGAYNRERFAEAFERLAAELRRDAVSVVSVKLSASLEANKIADQHELILKFIYMPEV